MDHIRKTIESLSGEQVNVDMIVPWHGGGRYKRDFIGTITEILESVFVIEESVDEWIKIVLRIRYLAVDYVRVMSGGPTVAEIGISIIAPEDV